MIKRNKRIPCFQKKTTNITITSIFSFLCPKKTSSVATKNNIDIK